MMYLALGFDGHIHNLCDCGDFESAEESAKDLGIDTVWIIDRPTAKEWAKTINHHLETYPNYDER